MIEIGNRFGRFTVIKGPEIRVNGFTKIRKRKYWKCKCECGRYCVKEEFHLRQGLTRSCGCLQNEVRIENGRKNKTHGESIHTKRSREWRAWRAMKDRCSRSPTARDYPKYGGRGISVCERWQDSYENFLSDMGRCPKGLTLDRIDNDGNYEIGNCRWATRKEQQGNTRQNHWIEHEGRKMIMADWAREIGINYSYMCDLIKEGRTIEEIIKKYQ